MIEGRYRLSLLGWSPIFFSILVSLVNLGQAKQPLVHVDVHGIMHIEVGPFKHGLAFGVLSTHLVHS